MTKCLRQGYTLLRTTALCVVTGGTLSACQPPAHPGIHPLMFVQQGPNGQTGFVPPPYPFDIVAETGLPARCINHVLAADLLSRNGSPTVPVGINGEEGAGFLSPSEDMIGVFDGNDDNLDLPDLQQIGSQTISGVQNTWTTRIRQLVFAQGHAEKVDGIKLGETTGESSRVAMSAIAVLGFDMLGNYNVLLNIPARRATFFMETHAAGCPPLSTAVGGHAFRAPLLTGRTGVDNLVSVTLDGAAIGMHLEPGSNLSVISEQDALADGLTRAALDEGDRVNTLNGSTLVGYRHTYRQVDIGNWHGANFPVSVEPANYNLLGRDFFRHRKVLMAFPTAMMFFSGALDDTGAKDVGPGNLSPIASHVAHATASQH